MPLIVVDFLLLNLSVVMILDFSVVSIRGGHLFYVSTKIVNLYLALFYIRKNANKQLTP
ncbi:hypothetical protein BDF14DRAFT_1781910 [Spinellus fusiger]|nr:hypothetical protein BDF14DRAFT_1781910 [Spinellus fusiger]